MEVKKVEEVLWYYFLSVPHFLPQSYFLKHPNWESTFLKSALIFSAVFLNTGKEANSIRGSLALTRQYALTGFALGYGFCSWRLVECRKCISSFFHHQPWPGSAAWSICQSLVHLSVLLLYEKYVCCLVMKLHCLSEPTFKALLLRWTSNGIHREPTIWWQGVRRKARKEKPKMPYRVVGTWWKYRPLKEILGSAHVSAGWDTEIPHTFKRQKGQQITPATHPAKLYTRAYCPITLTSVHFTPLHNGRSLWTFQGSVTLSLSTSLQLELLGCSHSR